MVSTGAKIGLGIGGALATLGAIAASVASLGTAAAPAAAGAVAADTAVAGAIAGTAATDAAVTGGAAAADAAATAGAVGGAAADAGADAAAGTSVAASAGAGAGAGTSAALPGGSLINSAVNAGLSAGTAAGGTAGGGTVVSSLPTIAAGGVLPVSMGGLPLATPVLPTIGVGALPMPVSLGGLPMATSTLPSLTGGVGGVLPLAGSAEAGGIGANVLPSVGSVGIGAGGSATSPNILPTAGSSAAGGIGANTLPSASSVGIGGGGSATTGALLPSSSSVAGSSTLPTMTYPTLPGSSLINSAANAGMGTTAGSSAATSGGLNSTQLAQGLTKSLGGIGNAIKAGLPQGSGQSQMPIQQSGPAAPNLMMAGANMGTGSLFQNPMQMSIPPMAFGNQGMQGFNLPQPMQAQMGQGSIPPLALSDMNSKMNIFPGNKEMDSILNGIYLKLKR